jgi:hypothetical protein
VVNLFVFFPSLGDVPSVAIKISVNSYQFVANFPNFLLSVLSVNSVAISFSRKTNPIPKRTESMQPLVQQRITKENRPRPTPKKQTQSNPISTWEKEAENSPGLCSGGAAIFSILLFRF